MLYYLFRYLENEFDLPGAGLFEYISFRAAITLILSLFFSMIIGKRIIGRLRSHQIGETIRNLGLQGENSKKGTPTMGGIIIIIAIIVPLLLMGRLRNIYLLLMMFTTIWLGLIGFLDDSIKVFKRNKEGLNGKYKIIGQVTLGLLVGIVLCTNDNVTIREKIASDGNESVAVYEDVKSTKTNIPFVKDNQFDYSWLAPFKGKAKEIAGWGIYILVIIFIITAVSNGTNLTDGMDGLATGTSAIIGTAIGILAYLSGNSIYASYLNMMYIPATGEVVIFMAAFVGALIGFLWYNTFPAQVFMGDTGSLALGGIIAVSAIIIRKELLIPILCGIFFVESISVIVQRLYFKYTKRKYGEGRRVFKMSPLHHHFQKEGTDALIKRPRRAIPEAKIVVRFWIITILLCALSIITLKIR